MNQSLRVLINLGLIAALLLPIGGIGLAEQRASNPGETGELNIAAPNDLTGSTETYTIYLPSVSSLKETATQPPSIYNKLTPTNGATNQPTSLILDWDDSSGATSYSYCYDTSNDNACSSWTSTGVTSQASISALNYSTTYYWQVRATNAAGTTYADGSSTAYWSFTTDDGSVIPDEMILIPAGEFLMGCDPEHNGGFDCQPDELPLHTVYLDAYYIDAIEVTNTQYAECVAAGSCAPPMYNSSYTRPSYYDNPTYANYPVIYVSWYNARDYCTWAGKRLPTEAEWEKAARGPSVRAYPWGDGDPNCTLANGANCVGETSEVGSYPLGASPYGALDMAGNVWEWVNDWSSSTYYNSSPYENPTGPGSGTYKVLRGGGWNEYWYTLRVVNRFQYIPEHRTRNVGFRCVDPSGN
jgi:formylglycine-generating enzyme required for sulfatase activity